MVTLQSFYLGKVDLLTVYLGKHNHKSQQEMMMKAEEQDRLAMQQLMKFEVEAEKRHQEFTLAALKELGNIFKKD